MAGVCRAVVAAGAGAICVLGCASGGSPLPSGPAAGGTGNTTPLPAAGTGGLAGSGGAVAPVAGTASGGAATGGGGSAGAGSDGMGLPAGEMTAPAGKIPNMPMPAEKVDLDKDAWPQGIISPTLEAGTHWNQPIVYNGYLQLSGNCAFSLYDVQDPTMPVFLSRFDSPSYQEGKEAESHQVSIARYGDKLYQVTTAGTGVDIWDITNPMAVQHLKLVELEGINYGDNTNAVWGVYWQGDTIYVGGTNQGLFVLDASDPTDVKGIKGGAKEPPTLTTSQLGSVSAGPLWAMGNVLIVTTPKESGGIATVDIGDPQAPFLLDSISTAKSYIGGFYGKHVFLQGPLRAWDVLTDPLTIPEAPVGELSTSSSEYMSFSDGYMFLGHLRPNAGASKINVTDVAHMVNERRIWGRLEFSNGDDQFTIALGSVLVLTDDEKPYRGAVIGVHDTMPDSKPPKVEAILPKDGETGVATTSSVGLSFSDNIEIATVHPASLIVRTMAGVPVAGNWGLYMGVLNFDPEGELQPATTYEVVLPAGGIKDLVGNGIASEFKSTFTTK